MDWARHLPWALLGIRAAPKEQLSLPGQLLHTEEVPADSMRERVKMALQSFTGAARTYAEVVSEVPPELRGVSHVYVWRGAVGPLLTPCYNGLYEVLERSPKFFMLQIGKRVEVVSADGLKPHTVTGPVSSADPPH